MPDPADDGLTPADRRLRDHLIAEADAHGTAYVEVAGDADGAPYTFTVGAWQRLGVPEAVTIGLPEGAGRTLIDAYLQRARRGETFQPGQVWDDLLEGVLVTIERVNKGHYFEFFGSAFLVYPEGDFDAIQLITATPQDDWPWEATAPPGFDLWQTDPHRERRPGELTPGVDGP